MHFFKNIVVAILTLESRLILAKYKPFIVAVTGSVGKTSTKDAIYSVLKDQSKYVRKAEKSMNSDVGLPLTIIGVSNAWHSVSGWLRNIVQGARLILRKSEYPDCLVLELGADHPGDIRKIVSWLHPDISVITQVSSTPVHVEFFKSPEEVFEEKASLATGIKNGGTLVLFADNEKVASLADRVSAKNVKVITFGTTEKAQVKGSEQKIVYEISDLPVGAPIQDLGSDGLGDQSANMLPHTKVPSGFTFKLDMNGTSAPISIVGLLGKSYMYPLLAAAAVGGARSIPLSTIVRGLNAYDAPKSRMNIISGMKGTTIIDDTYNSSPDAAISALNTLKDIECGGTKIAALGDMMELGQYAAEEHRRVGREAVASAQVLVTVGPRSRATADEAIKHGMSVDRVKAFDSSVDAGSYIQSIIKPGDVVLVKGSQSIRMERAVKMLMKDTSRAEALIVRQEKEWLEKK